MSDRLIGNIIKGIKEQQSDISRGGMLYPKSEPFEHGVQVGTYQGLEIALQVLTGALDMEAETERKS